MRRNVSRVAPWALTLLLSAACASAPAPPAADSAAAPGVTVFSVQNNAGSARDVVVYLEPEGRGERQNLGTLGAGRTAEFQHAPARGYYELIAAHNLGETRSPRFNISGPSTVTWMMGTNRVVVNRR